MHRVGGPVSASELFAVLLMVAVVPLAHTSRRHAMSPEVRRREALLALARVHGRVMA